MGWQVVRGGLNGIRVVFADKTFLDFPDMHAQFFSWHESNLSGDLEIGDWTGMDDKWIAVAIFPKNSYSYVVQIPLP